MMKIFWATSLQQRKCRSWRIFSLLCALASMHILDPPSPQKCLLQTIILLPMHIKVPTLSTQRSLCCIASCGPKDMETPIHNVIVVVTLFQADPSAHASASRFSVFARVAPLPPDVHNQSATSKLSRASVN